MSIRKPALGTILGTTALVVALAGTGPGAEAAKLINGKLIKANTVTSKQIKDGTITSKDLAKNLRTPNGKGIAGPAGAPGPAGPKGDTGAKGADGAALAVVAFEPSGTKTFSKVDGTNLACASPLCLAPKRRITVTKTAAGVYCVKVEKSTGLLPNLTWSPYISAAGDYAALSSVNGALPGFVQQWGTCDTTGFEIHTFNSAGTHTDLAATVAIF